MDKPIPKIAHFIWLGSVMPETSRLNIEKFRSLHPGWEIKIWLQYPGDLPESMRAMLQKMPEPKSRVELLRLWILQTYGGVYLDTDIYLLRSIDELLVGKPFTSLTYHNRAVAPVIIGSAPNSPALYWLMGTVNQIEEGFEYPGLFGAHLFTRMRENHPILMRFLPEHYFCLFRVGGIACRFLRKSEPDRAAELKTMWRRFPDETSPFGIHTWGHTSWLAAAAPAVRSTAPERLEEITFSTKIKNLTKAVGRLGRALFKREKVLVDDEEYKRRLAICTGTETIPTCRFYQKGTCTRCGCVTAYKNRLATEHCPNGLW